MSPRDRTLLEKLRLVVALIAVALVVILFFQNQETVTTHVFFWTVAMPRFVLLGSVFVMGALAGYLVAHSR